MFKPMLAPNVDPMRYPAYFEELRFPLYCSPKLDGIRNIVKEYRCKSRKFIDLPSLQVQNHFNQWMDLDGELIVGDETDFDVYNRTQSHVMSRLKPADDLKFRVFDWADVKCKDTPYIDRLEIARDMVGEYRAAFTKIPVNVSIVEHTMVTSLDTLLAYEATQLELGYEGIMMRDPVGRYKHNRGTWKEGLIYKLKRFEDFEVQVVGFIEQNTNTNEEVRDNLGHAKRSTAKAGMVGAGTLGKIIGRYNDATHGIIDIEIGMGVMTHKERKIVYDNQERYLNRYAKVRHFPHGKKDLPRMPRFVGWRDIMDFDL